MSNQTNPGGQPANGTPAAPAPAPAAPPAPAQNQSQQSATAPQTRPPFPQSTVAIESHDDKPAPGTSLLTEDK